MTRSIINIFSIIFGLIFFSSWTSQSTNKNLSFVDDYGDTFLIYNIDKLPSNQLDSSFFKKYFNGLLFNKKLLEKINRYDYFISEIKSTNKKNQFEFYLRTDPQSNQPPHDSYMEDVLKYMNSRVHCRMTIKKVNGLTQLVSIELMYTEI